VGVGTLILIAVTSHRIDSRLRLAMEIRGSKESRIQAVAGLRDLLSTHCRVHAATALAFVGDVDESREGEHLLRQTFENYDRSRQGDMATPEQEIATAALGFLAAQRPLTQTTVDSIAKKVENDEADLSTPILRNILLNEVARWQPLTSTLKAYILSTFKHETRRVRLRPFDRSASSRT
jgi:hypothetical protein